MGQCPLVPGGPVQRGQAWQQLQRPVRQHGQLVIAVATSEVSEQACEGGEGGLMHRWGRVWLAPVSAPTVLPRN